MNYPVWLPPLLDCGPRSDEVIFWLQIAAVVYVVVRAIVAPKVDR